MSIIDIVTLISIIAIAWVGGVVTIASLTFGTDVNNNEVNREDGE